MDDRLHVVLGPYDFLWEQLAGRLYGLTDDEYFWEPVASCWNLRPRGKATSGSPIGRGDWLLDGQSPPPDPEPFTTIAWRLCHMASGHLLRYDWTFGTQVIFWIAAGSDYRRLSKSACVARPRR